MPTKGREMELVYQLGYVAKQDVIYEWSQSTKTKATASKKQQSTILGCGKMGIVLCSRVRVMSQAAYRPA